MAILEQRTAAASAFPLGGGGPIIFQDNSRRTDNSWNWNSGNTTVTQVGTPAAADRKKKKDEEERPSMAAIAMFTVLIFGGVWAGLSSFSRYSEDRKLDRDLKKFAKADASPIDALANAVKQEAAACRNMVHKRLQFDKALCALVTTVGVAIIAFGYDKLIHRSQMAFQVGMGATLFSGGLAAVAVFNRPQDDWYTGLWRMLQDGATVRSRAAA